MALSTEQICKEIANDFKRRRITHKIAAERIGTSKQTVSNQISGKKRFSLKMAQKFSEAFGYNEMWLLYGEGEMFKDGTFIHYIDPHDKTLYYYGNFTPILKEGNKLRMAERIIEILNNKVAISAFRAYINEDFDEYDSLIKKLESEYGYDTMIFTNNITLRNALRDTREMLTEIETKAAKELTRIEQKAAAGELILEDVEADRFKTRVILIKDMYKDKALQNNPDLSMDTYLPETTRKKIESLLPQKRKDKGEE